VHTPNRPSIDENVHLTAHAAKLAQGGYYYAVIVLERYKRYTRNSPPPCSTSSNMQRTDYGYPLANGELALTLAPMRSATRHWCRGATYAGAVYAVPHTPPCESAYPCSSESPGEQCVGVAPGCVHGVVARPRAYAYPDGLPTPRASGTAIVARFTVRFPG
jgi:hypothetical protein